MRRTRLYRDGVLEAEDFPAAKISDYLQQPGTVVWLDLCEPDQEDLELVSEEFGLHPLAVEDAVQQHERPKLDRYQDHYFLTAYTVSLDHDTATLTTSELAAFATPRALITVRKDLRFDIEGVVARWDGSADLASHGVGFLLWGLLDFVVDGTSPLLELMACQKFARNYATRNLTTPHGTALESASHLSSCEETRGAAQRCEPPTHRW